MGAVDPWVCQMSCDHWSVPAGGTDVLAVAEVLVLGKVALQNGTNFGNQFIGNPFFYHKPPKVPSFGPRALTPSEKLAFGGLSEIFRRGLFVVLYAGVVRFREPLLEFKGKHQHKSLRLDSGTVAQLST